MEEPDGFAGSEVDGRDVRPLVAITKDAAIGQIVEGRTTTVFATYNVVDLVSESRPAFRVKTVLAAILRTADDLLPGRLRQLTRHASLSVQRAPLPDGIYVRVERNILARTVHLEKAAPLSLVQLVLLRVAGLAEKDETR